MTLSTLLATAALIIAVLAAVLVVRHTRQLDERLMSLRQERTRLMEAIEGLSAGAVSQGERTARVEQELQRLKERLTMLGSRESGGEAFDQAIRMARKGLPADEISDACGLSKVEADLVVLIHQEKA